MSYKNKVKSCALAFLLSGTLLFTACSDDTQTSIDGKKIAESDDKAFTFQYPDTWQVLRSDSMYAIAASDNSANITVAGYALTDDFTSLDEYVSDDENGYIHYLRENFGDRIEVTEEVGEEYTIADRESKCLTYHIKIGEDTYHFVTVLTTLPTIGSTYLYQINYTALDEDAFSEHLGAFRDVIGSFVFN